MKNKYTKTRIVIMKNDKAILNLDSGLAAFLSFAATFALVFMGILYLIEEPLYSTVYIVFAILFFIPAKNYIANTFSKIDVIVNNQTLKIGYKSWGKLQESEFELKNIKYIKFIDKENFTNDSLDPETRDYIGFGAAEKEMYYMRSKGAIEIKTNDGNLRFGKNIPSWEADRVIMLVQKAISKA